MPTDLREEYDEKGYIFEDRYPDQTRAVVSLTHSFHGLSICQDLVGHSVGGRALGVESLEYPQYN